MPLSDNAKTSKDARAGVPEMQHRHFAFIAAIIRGTPDQDGFLNSRQADLFRVDLAERFAAKLALTNPAFDKARFLKACRDK